jgi:amino acid transporter
LATIATSLKRLVVGNPIKSEQAIHERLTKKTALAVFSSDALSSTAYATEEILLVLAVAVAYGQAYAFRYVIPISIGIVVLLALVAISYRQTIHAYPSGGGAYIVAKDNLGTMPGLVAGASLLVDYILTVAVSVSAGVAAITSAAQGTHYAWLHNHKVALCIFFIALIALANLRGIRESGALFSFPTYAFLVSFLLMIGFGFFHYYRYGGAAPVPTEGGALAEGYHVQPVTLFLLLGAFSNGCSALTGVEAISNGVPAFKRPESKNAAVTLVWMAVLLGVMFLGTSILAYLYGVHPRENETVISQFARIMFTGPLSWFYYVVQATTAAILVLAANTSFADFPRLSSLLARDRFLPRQFAHRGDRLVFSNGIVILAVLSGILVVVFGGDTSRLIPLYAVGVFLSFTLSQAGMVKHWLKEGARLRQSPAKLPSVEIESTPKDEFVSHDGERVAQAEVISEAVHWKKSIAVNGLGAIATAIVLIVFIITKFIHGAWVVVVLIPLLVLMFIVIHRYYVNLKAQLAVRDFSALQPMKNTVIVPISGISQVAVNALNYAKAIAHANVTAVYVDFDEDATREVQERWRQWNPDGIELVVLPTPYRSFVQPILNFIDKVDERYVDDVITVVIPEYLPARWWQNFLNNQSSFLLKAALLFKDNVIVVSVPYHLKN